MRDGPQSCRVSALLAPQRPGLIALQRSTNKCGRSQPERQPMFSSSSFPKPAGMAGRLGSHLLLSLGIATAAASLVTLPRLLSREGGPALAPLPQASPLSLMAVADGKITDRLGWAGAEEEGDASAALHFTPAAFAMPMALGWPERDDRPLQQAASTARPELGRRGQAAAPLPPRRVAVVTEQKMAAPLVILPPAAMASAEPSAASEENLGGRAWRLVAAPATRVVDAVSGVAGSVQTAGSWTLSQATGLLPRW
jgi:hypothetical protein